MVVSDREKLIPGQEMGCVSEGCMVFTLRKKKTVRPEGAMQKLRGRAFQEESSKCEGPMMRAHS